MSSYSIQGLRMLVPFLRIIQASDGTYPVGLVLSEPRTAIILQD